MFPSSNDSPSQLSVSSCGPQSTPVRPRSSYRTQGASSSPYQSRLRCLVSRESPLPFSANSPLKKLQFHHGGSASDSSPSNIKSASTCWTFQNPYQTPQHRHLPAHTPLRVRRNRKKIHLKETGHVAGYLGARRLFKEEIFGIDNHTVVTHAAKEAIINVFEYGASNQN